MSGQLTEAYSVARLCLEHGLYGDLMGADHDAWSLWINRGENPKARKLCVRAFATGKLFDALRRRDSRLGNAAGELYELGIDFGAHPNELAALSTMEAKPMPDGGQRFEYSFLSGDGLPLRLRLKSITQIGLVVLDIAHLSFPLRCKLARIDDMIAPLKARY